MKKIVAIIAFAIILVNVCVCQGSNIGYKSIPPGYDTTHAKPLMFTKGDTIVINCDSVYILNCMKLNLYKNIAKMYESGDPNCNRLVQLCENSFIARENGYKKLIDNCKEAEDISLKLITNTRSSLENTQKTLEYTQTTLDQTINSLEQANKLIKKGKRESFFEKLMIGCGSAGIGILVGAWVTK